MNVRKLITSISIVLLCCLHAFGQRGSIKELKPIFDHLKTIKAYSFENHTNAVFPNGKSDAVVTKVYMDKANECLFYSNKGETLLLNHKWVYKASHNTKIVQIFDIKAYNKRNKSVQTDIKSLFQYDVAAGFVDSVVMKYGKLLSSEKKGSLTTYKIGFSEEAGIKQVIVIYNESSQLPESIYIRMLKEEGGKNMQTEILCNNYKAVIPPAVFDEHAYFSAINGKVTLTQYKNYKVYSLL